MIPDTVHPLWDVDVGNHPVERYEWWRRRLGTLPVPGLTPKDEIKLLAIFSVPCVMPDDLVQKRLRKHDGLEVAYWHTHPWRFVVHNGHMLTVEPDAYPGNLGLWRHTREVLFFWQTNGFTIQEITGGFIQHVQLTTHEEKLDVSG